MDEFSERVRAAADARSRQWPDARAGRERRRSIGRARALRVGGSAAIAAVVITGIGAAGVGFTGVGSAPEPSPSASPDLTLGQGDTAYATLPFPDEHEMDSHMRQLAAYCGGPVPETRAESEDFSVAYDIPERLDIDQQTGVSAGPAQSSAQLTFSGSSPLPAFVSGPSALFVEDGTVVGAAPDYQEPIVRTFQPGGTATYRWESIGGAASCDTESEPGFGFGTLEPGDYEMVLVTQVYNDEAAAATQSLRMDGYTLPVMSELPAFREGAYECDSEDRWGGITPLTCDPHALPGVEIDDEAGTVTVPYEASFYTEDVSLLYVSPPIAVTVTPNENGAEDFLLSPPVPGFERGTVPACGDQFGSIGTGSIQGPWDSMAGSLAGTEVGDALDPELWRRGSGWLEAEVTVPVDPRVWVLAQRDIAFDDGDGDASTESLYSAQEVVGWFDTDSGSDATTLKIVRYDGPETWPLSVTDVQWCEGFDSADTTDDNHLGMVASPSTVTLDDGTREELDALVFSP
ncbi:hypothetical protein [Demequina aestuarii]|uniref:hypothetical protein n=1 Tax=Demequina aestuarii TaxID=327095 RepID=UPI00128CEF6A|nr:hypothetical protein [Demequina aestuarii]